MRIVLASDHAAVDLRLKIMGHLAHLGHDVDDLGPEDGERVDYPDYAAALCGAIVSGEADCGVLLCGTGIGMSIAANKFAGIRAALVHDVTTARLSAEHNKANVLVLGARVLGPITALECVDAWLNQAFDPRHQARLDKITALE